MLGARVIDRHLFDELDAGLRERSPIVVDLRPREPVEVVWIARAAIVDLVVDEPSDTASP